MAEAARLRVVDTRELEGAAFRCLPGCGFCCTFPPEVSTREVALLRRRLEPRSVPLATDGERRFLALQNRCGACALLSARACAAYDERPAHCRYFPFHLHFGEEPGVSVNYSCRGVERRPGARLDDAFRASVLDVAKERDLRERDQEARATFAEFQRRARRAGAWGDARATARGALDRLGASLLSGDGVEIAAQRAGETLARDAWHDDAMRPFGADDVAKRPFHLTADLQWLTFERRDGDRLRVMEMDEAGSLEAKGEVAGLGAWADPPAAEALAERVRFLVGRPSFAGSVYAIVDDADYETTVEEAAWWRLGEIASDLAVRARVLAAMGIPSGQLADEAARFYDGAFLDAPTIGGWL
jgi:Fe-S-cluster containining protein